MFRLLASLAFLASAADGPDAMSVVRGNSRFAIDLYGSLREQSGNLFFSPSSISTALAMTYAGARGETARQMAEVLHLDGPAEQLHPAFAALHPTGERPGYRLRVANRLWGQRGYDFLPEFLALTRDTYHAELAPVDFAQTERARMQINDWVRRQTEGKIEDLIPADVLTPRTRLVLTNAVYFKADWARPFARGATTEAEFRVTSDKATRVPMMHRRGETRHWAGDGLKAVELPYAGGDLAMVVLLPDAVDGLSDLEARLGEERLSGWMEGLREQDVDLSLPRFKTTSRLALKDALRALGMTLAFDRDRADFSGIAGQEGLYVDAVVHQAYVDVDERGTEAAAATGVVLAPRSAVVRPEPVVFKADHPFVFLVRDTRTGAILFLGRVVNPKG